MDDARFHELLDRWQDGEATSAEAAELEAALREDRERRRAFVERSLQEAGLLEAFASLPAKAEARRPARRRRVEAPRSAWLPAVIAAAVLFGIVVLLASTPAPPRRPAVEARTTPPPPMKEGPVPEAPREAPAPPAVEESPAPEPVVPPVVDEDRRRVAAALERERVEREMQAALEAERARRPAPPPPVEAPPAPRETVPAAPRPELARLEDLAGEAVLVDGASRAPARRGAALRQGEGLEVAGRATLKFPDGTRVELGADSAAVLPGPHVQLASGTLKADVVRRPKGRPFVFRTPHAEATVLGTSLTLVVDASSTRLEVSEGRVRLRRLSDGAAVEVAAGHFAVAAPAVELAARPVAGETFRISFGPKDGSAPEGYAVDDGSPFDAARGWGWSRDVRSFARNRSAGRDPLLRRSVTAGSTKACDRWEIAVPNGRYLVFLACGDSEFAQGPHGVVAEGVPVVVDAFTQAGKHAIVKGVPVSVQDGRFTLELGAIGSTKRASDGSDDTTINYLVIQRFK